MLIELEMQNIGAYNYAKVTFGTGKIIIHGSNGSGKSTIIRGIIFGLFGDFNLLPEIEPFELVKIGQGAGSIRTVFTDPSRQQTVTIARSLEVRRKKNGWTISQTSAILTIGDREVSGVDAVKKEVQAILGISSRLFINTVVGFQGEISAIARRKTSQDTFDRIFGIRDFKDAWDDFRPIIKDLETSVSAIEREITDWERDLKNASGIRDEYDRAIQQISSAEREISVMAHPSANGSVDRLREEIVRESQSMDRLVQKRTEAETILNGKAKQLGDINQQVCPTCETTLTPEYRKRLMARFRKDAKAIEQQVHTMGTRINTAQAHIKEKEGELIGMQTEATVKQTELTRRRTELDILKDTVLPSLEQRLADLDTLAQRIQSEKRTLRESTSALKLGKLVREAFREVRPILRQGRIAKVEGGTNAVFRDLFGQDIDITISPVDYSIGIKEDDGGVRSTRTLSGGEAVNLGLALRLAIVKAIGGQDVLILDEPTESMDEFRKGRLVDVLESLQTDVQIIVVTHSPLLISAGDHLVRVEKRGGSRIEQVN